MPQLTQDQIDKLKSLGIEINENNQNIKPSFLRDEVPQEQVVLNYETTDNQAISPIDLTKSSQTNDSNQNNNSLDPNSKNLRSTIYHQRPIFPLLSISGLTLLSLSGLIL